MAASGAHQAALPALRRGLTTTLTLNGALIVAAGLVGRWRLHNHPEALRGLMRSLTR